MELYKLLKKYEKVRKRYLHYEIIMILKNPTLKKLRTEQKAIKQEMQMFNQ